jgi:Permeases of the drug/metabolite transporter (DMT) superfamily
MGLEQKPAALGCRKRLEPEVILAGLCIAAPKPCPASRHPLQPVQLTPLESAALIRFWSAVLFLSAYLLFGLSRPNRASAGEITLQALYQGVLMSGGAIFTFNRAVSLLGSAAATAIIALLPAVASFLAVSILSKTPSCVEYAAIAIMVAGVLLASRRPAMANPTPQSQRRAP